MDEKIYGLIAEYNPFHKAHESQLRYAKTKLGADYVIVVLSGDFCQRGIPAIMEKHLRAALALSHGADLVIEMPVVGATSSAEGFARTGVGILSALNVCKGILFGAENPDTEKFNQLADILGNESFMFKKTLKDHMKAGLTHARARVLALEDTTGDSGLSEFINSPNNILGVEYVKALRIFKSNMDFFPVDRQTGARSSSLLRSELHKNGPRAIEEEVSEDTFRVLQECHENGLLTFINDFSMILHEALIKNNDFTGFLDSNMDLSNRTEKYKSKFLDTKDFAGKVVKSKNITLTHVMRYLTHIMLDITQADQTALRFLEYAPYSHVLGVKKGSEGLLSLIKERSKIPVFTSYKEATEILGDRERILYEKDLYAADIYRVVLTGNSGSLQPDERSRKFLVV